MTSDFIAIVAGPIISITVVMVIVYNVGWMRGYREARKTYSDGLSEMTTTMRNALKEFEPTADPNHNDARKFTH